MVEVAFHGDTIPWAIPGRFLAFGSNELAVAIKLVQRLPSPQGAATLVTLMSAILRATLYERAGSKVCVDP